VPLIFVFIFVSIFVSGCRDDDGDHQPPTWSPPVHSIPHYHLCLYFTYLRVLRHLQIFINRSILHIYECFDTYKSSSTDARCTVFALISQNKISLSEPANEQILLKMTMMMCNIRAATIMACAMLLSLMTGSSNGTIDMFLMYLNSLLCSTFVWPNLC
jgi:hypothetical protein